MAEMMLYYSEAKFLRRFSFCLVDSLWGHSPLEPGLSAVWKPKLAHMWSPRRRTAWTGAKASGQQPASNTRRVDQAAGEPNPAIQPVQTSQSRDKTSCYFPSSKFLTHRVSEHNKWVRKASVTKGTGEGTARMED